MESQQEAIRLNHLVEEVSDGDQAHQTQLRGHLEEEAMGVHPGAVLLSRVDHAVGSTELICTDTQDGVIQEHSPASLPQAYAEFIGTVQLFALGVVHRGQVTVLVLLGHGQPKNDRRHRAQGQGRDLMPGVEDVIQNDQYQPDQARAGTGDDQGDQREQHQAQQGETRHKLLATAPQGEYQREEEQDYARQLVGPSNDTGIADGTLDPLPEDEIPLE